MPKQPRSARARLPPANPRAPRALMMTTGKSGDFCDEEIVVLPVEYKDFKNRKSSVYPFTSQKYLEETLAW